MFFIFSLSAAFCFGAEQVIDKDSLKYECMYTAGFGRRLTKNDNGRSRIKLFCKKDQNNLFNGAYFTYKREWGGNKVILNIDPAYADILDLRVNQDRSACYWLSQSASNSDQVDLLRLKLDEKCLSFEHIASIVFSVPTTLLYFSLPKNNKSGKTIFDLVAISVYGKSEILPYGLFVQQQN